MIKTLVTALVGVGAVVIMALPTLAHHSGAMFEEKKTITVEGVVKEFQVLQPALMADRRREGEGRHGHHVGFRSRRAEHAAPCRHPSE